MSGPVVVLDAWVLVPIRLAMTVLRLAESGLFQPLWSQPILVEVQRNLPKVAVTPERASRRVAMMRDAPGAEALIDSLDGLIEQMTSDRELSSRFAGHHLGRGRATHRAVRWGRFGVASADPDFYVLAAGSGQSRVAGQDWALQRFGECHVCGVVGIEIVAKAVCTQPQRGSAGPPLDG